MKKKFSRNLILVLFPIITFSQGLQKQKIEALLGRINDKANYMKLTEDEKLKLSSQLYNLSKEAGYKKGMLIARIKEIHAYMSKADANSTLKLVAETLPLAKELNNYNSYSYLFEVKARALTFSKDYDVARENYSKAIQQSTFIKSQDTLHLRNVSIYTGLLDYALSATQVFDKKVYMDSAIYFGHKAYREAKRIQTGPFKYLCIGQATQALGGAYISSGDSKKGENFLDEAEAALEKSYNPINIAAVYIYRGDYEFKKKNYNKGLEYFDKALEMDKKYNFPMVGANVYPILIEYYKKMGNKEKLLYYTEKNSELRDSLAIINQYALITQKKLDKKERKPQSFSGWKWILTGSLAVLFGVILYLYIIRKRKKDLKSPELIENKRFESENLATLLNLAKNNDKQFLIVFQETFPNLYHKLLEFPELTPSDLELCALLKLNLQTKEIATYKKTTVGAVDNRKYRLRKKLNLAEKINLYKWIETL
jgi:tetratricopeptide (TPR) repeat protein